MLAKTRSTLTSRLFQPVDVASLAAFRVAFGVIMFWEVCRYFAYGWIARYYIEPTFHFTYYGFGWLRPLPGGGMYWLFAGLGVCALGIALGAWYRVCATLFFVGFAYVFLLDEARYLNHFYLVFLVSLLMIFLPAQRCWSVDVWRRPALRRVTVSAWSLWILRAQIGIVYFYGGIAKLGADWLAGEPVRMWLAARIERGELPAALGSDLFVFTICYGGLLFDLCIVPLLLWHRSRRVAFIAAVLFHVINSWLFDIGIFPWLAIAATTLFLSPSWPRRLLRLDVPLEVAYGDAPSPPTARRRVVLALLALYLAVQLLVPLRHWLYPGDVNWTEQGHRFAWRMKLRSKKGDARFFVHDPSSDEVWEVDPASFLTDWQYRSMATHPDMIVQFAHHVAAEFGRANPGRRSDTPVEVRVEAIASLNGRPPQWLVDPTVNLAALRRNLLPAPWIVPRGKLLTAPAPPS